MLTEGKIEVKNFLFPVLSLKRKLIVKRLIVASCINKPLASSNGHWRLFMAAK